MSERLWQRLGAACGIVYVVLLIGGGSIRERRSPVRVDGTSDDPVYILGYRGERRPDPACGSTYLRTGISGSKRRTDSTLKRSKTCGSKLFVTTQRS